jgi:hypothetical protein
MPRRCHEDREVAKNAKDIYPFFFVVIAVFVVFAIRSVAASAFVR